MEAWEILEKNIAKNINGKITPGSGNKGVKGDVQNSAFIIEAKWRSSQNSEGRCYIDLQAEWLTKLARQARKIDKEPVLIISIANIVELCVVTRDFANNAGWVIRGSESKPVVSSVRIYADRVDYFLDYAIELEDGSTYVIVSLENFEGAALSLVPKEKFERRKETPEQKEKRKQYGKERYQSYKQRRKEKQSSGDAY